MKFVALVSGGKDSLLSLQEAHILGHELVCVANLYPPALDQPEEDLSTELDSHTFQTVGAEIVQKIAHCLCVPLVSRPLKGTPK